MFSCRSKYFKTSCWLLIGALLGLFSGLTLGGLIKFKLADFLAADVEISHPDALVVMAGERDARLPTAASLFLRVNASRILLTNDGVLGRWSKEHQRNLYHVEWARRRLIEHGVPESAIVTLPFSKSGTIHDVRAVQRYTEASGIERLLVVTSDYHTRRTLWTFHRVFKDSSVQVGICGAKSATQPESGFWQGLDEYRKLIVEFGKYLYYRVCY